MKGIGLSLGIESGSAAWSEAAGTESWPDHVGWRTRRGATWWEQASVLYTRQVGWRVARHPVQFHFLA